MESKIPSENERIKNLKCRFESGNAVRITWDWPPLDTGIDTCYILSTNNPSKKPSAITRGEYIKDGHYTIYIKEDFEQYIIYPGKNKVMYKQTEDNTTPLLYKKIQIKYRVKYKSLGLFRGQKRAFISFGKDLDKVKRLPKNSVRYYKQPSLTIFEYPLDIDMLINDSYLIILDKNEYLKLVIGGDCSESFKDAVTFYDLE